MTEARHSLLTLACAVGALTPAVSAQLAFDEQPSINIGLFFGGRTFCSDLDGINGPDVVIPTDDVVGFAYGFLLNDGSGGFALGDTANGNTSVGSRVVGGDWDGDGLTDVLALEPGSPADLVLLRQVSPGTWSHTDVLVTSGSASGLVACDFDGNGQVDVAMSNTTTGAVDVYLNDGSGLVNGLVAASYPMGTVLELRCCDLDADGRPDMITIDATGSLLRVRLGTAGGFGSASLYFLGAAPTDLVCCDVNADGLPDVAVTSETGGTVSVLLNNGSGGLTGTPPVATGSNPRTITCGDFDCDGDVDLVFSTGTVLRGILNDGTAASWTVVPGSFGTSGGSPISDVFACELDGAPGTDLLTVRGFGIAVVRPFFNIGADCGSCIAPPPDPVAWYSGGDFCTPEDTMGNHDATFVGLPFCPMAKVGGGALGFDGLPTPTYLSVPAECQLDPEGHGYTVNAWIRTDEPGFQPIAAKGGALGGFEFLLVDGRLRVVTCNTTFCWQTTGSSFINDGDWHHVAFTIVPGPSSVISVWVDGVLENSTVAALGAIDSPNPLLLGAFPSPTPSSYLDGAMDEIQIHDRALSAGEIQAIYLAGIAGQCPTEVCQPTGEGESPDIVELLAGIPDDFALPAEPNTHSLTLNPICFTGVDFDLIADDTSVCHTFDGLPSGIVGGTLEIRIRATTDPTPVCNDTIQLQGSGSPVSFEWSRRLGAPGAGSCAGPEGLLDCTWEDGITHTFCLDLAALPLVAGGTTSVVDTMNTTDRLDVRIQDDSGVDYMLLRLAVCDCPGDASCDGEVGVSDLLDVLADWGPCPAPCPPCAADVNEDCTVDVSDLLLVLGAWGPC